MTASSPAKGEVLPFTERVGCAPSPPRVVESVSREFSEDRTKYFEQRGRDYTSTGRAVIVGKSCLRIESRNRELRLKATSPNGANVLRAVEPEGTSLEVLERTDSKLCLEVPATDRTVPVRQQTSGRGQTDGLRVVLDALEPVERPVEPILFAIGCFAYEFADYLEGVPESDWEPGQFPHYEFVLPEQFCVIDGPAGTSTAVALAVGADGARQLCERAENQVRRCESLLESLRGEPSATADRIAGCDKRPERRRDVRVDISDDEFAATVERAKTFVESGDVYQVVPSRTFRLECPRPMSAFRHLEATNPSPYHFYCEFEGRTLFGASPETCVEVDGSDRELVVRPIAGTRRRGLTAAGQIDRVEDARMETDLRLDTKEVAEHMMLVDLARNDVARASRPASRHVSELLRVDRFSNVMHLVSEVTGRLRPEVDALDAYVMTANMGTLVGAPKIRAAELIKQLEIDARGPYGGAVGYVTDRGDLSTAIAIRSAFVQQGVASVRAGAGIVRDSVPAREARETENKARAVLRAVEAGNRGGLS